MALKPIKTYRVSVDGFSDVYFSARSPAKARATAYRAYTSYDDTCTFKRFLEISSIRRGADPAGVGERVTIGGQPATRVIPSGGSDGHYVYRDAYMRDDSEVIFTAHPSEVHPISTST